jgi:hypothetical protein
MNTHPQFYGWITTGNQRTEIYKSFDAHGAPVWTRATVYHGEPLGQHATFSERIAAESVANYDVTPEFNIV